MWTFHNAPHRIELCFVNLMNLDFHLCWMAIRTYRWIDGVQCQCFFLMLG